MPLLNRADFETFLTANGELDEEDEEDESMDY
jgi:hypothetical protein